MNQRKFGANPVTALFMILYLASLVLLIVHMANTSASEITVILALIGYLLLGLLPGVLKKSGKYDCVVCGISIGSFLHIGAGLLATISVNLAIAYADDDDRELLIASSILNVITTYLAHYLFVVPDDDSFVGTRTTRDYMQFLTVGAFIALIWSVSPAVGDGSEELEGVLVALAMFAGLVTCCFAWLLQRHIVFFSATILSIVSYRLPQGEVSDAVSFGFILLGLVSSHFSDRGIFESEEERKEKEQRRKKKAENKAKSGKRVEYNPLNKPRVLV